MNLRLPDMIEYSKSRFRRNSQLGRGKQRDGEKVNTKDSHEQTAHDMDELDMSNCDKLLRY